MSLNPLFSSHSVTRIFIRGARNALMLLSPEAKKLGVITASAGNHALALAWHGKDLGIPVTCVMPVVAPLTKVDKCRKIGARIILHGQHIGEAKEYCYKEFPDLKYINGYDDPEIIAGAGSMGKLHSLFRKLATFSFDLLY